MLVGLLSDLSATYWKNWLALQLGWLSSYDFCLIRSAQVVRSLLTAGLQCLPTSFCSSYRWKKVEREREKILLSDLWNEFTNFLESGNCIPCSKFSFETILFRADLIHLCSNWIKVLSPNYTSTTTDKRQLIQLVTLHSYWQRCIWTANKPLTRSRLGLIGRVKSRDQVRTAAEPDADPTVRGHRLRCSSAASFSSKADSLMTRRQWSHYHYLLLLSIAPKTWVSALICCLFIHSPIQKTNGSCPQDPVVILCIQWKIPSFSRVVIWAQYWWVRNKESVR